MRISRAPIWVISGCFLMASFLGIGSTQASESEKNTGKPGINRYEVQSSQLVYRNGRIFTANHLRPWAEAVAIDDGKFILVGSDTDVEAAIGSATRVVDLKGQLVIPGLHEVHNHAVDRFAEVVKGHLSFPYDVDLEELKQKIRTYAKDNPDKKWIVGGRFSPAVLPHEMARELLDELVPGRPAAIKDITGHMLWVNSRALEAAGITKETPDPPLGAIIRDPKSGEPTGFLEESAMPLVSSLYTHFEPVVWTEAVKRAVKAYNEVGITSARGASGQLEQLVALREQDKKGQLSVRYIMPWVSPTAVLWPLPPFAVTERQIRENLKQTTPHVRANSLKVFVDGGYGETLAMLEPYKNNPDTIGVLNIAPEELNHMVTRFDAMGVSVMMHTIGDRASRVALDAVQAAREANGPDGMRHQLSHCELITKKDLNRFSQLNAAMDISPIFPDHLVKPYYAEVLGQKRADRVYPYRWAVEARARPALASDYAVSPLSPFLHMQTMVTRGKPLDEKAQPGVDHQRATIEEAILSYTLNGAHVMMQENLAGSIEVGKYADFVVLDQDLFKIPPDQISQVRVVQTVFEGEAVYSLNTEF